jgi:adenosylcobinamide kinase/adenosylcobinamide-phosphate guanylyltransferase
MPKQLTLILGGARSGKSAYAEKLAADRGGSVLYVATAQALDDEMTARIAAHQAQRPDHWRTLEAPRAVGPALARTLAESDPAPTSVLIDCITLLASNVILALPEPVNQAQADAALTREIDELLAAYETAAEGEWILVSNEVGLGVVPAYSLGRVYRDALGRANQRLAAAADRVIFMAAGLPLVMKGA